MVGLASLASQRFGQGIAGLISGFPVIAASVSAILLWSAPLEKVQAIAHASYTSVPAAFAYTLAFAWCAHALHQRGQSPRWWQCLLAATVAFLSIGIALWIFRGPAWIHAVFALACPLITLALMPKASDQQPFNFAIPKLELLLRMLIAFAMAFALTWGTEHFPASWSGLILVWPVTGCVLPCFTVALYGAPATVQLLRGFTNGLLGFTMFFVAFAYLMQWGVRAGIAFLLAMLLAAISAYALWKTRQARRATPPTIPVAPPSM